MAPKERTVAMPIWGDIVAVFFGIVLFVDKMCVCVCVCCFRSIAIYKLQIANGLFRRCVKCLLFAPDSVCEFFIHSIWLCSWRLSIECNMHTSTAAPEAMVIGYVCVDEWIGENRRKLTNANTVKLHIIFHWWRLYETHSVLANSIMSLLQIVW